MKDLELAFDVGHSSIGWAVLQNNPQLELKGCGAVIFRPDDCLASKRRDYRRQRRHIRSTRQRIKRMKALLLHLSVLTQTQLDKPGCA
jgi:CRISPR/Cas system Type II protein with McrA/HNH and RuvC-like nuclease domain